MCRICAAYERENRHPKEGALRVWWIPQVPMKAFHYPVSSVAEAKRLLDILAKYDFFQLFHNIKPDYSNVGGLEVYENREWIDWSNENGDGIDDVDKNGNTSD